MLRTAVSLFAVTLLMAAALPMPGASAQTGCTITGTSGDDTLDGTSGPDVICGLGGADTINGLGGNDVIEGGSGADVLNGGEGADRINGGDDADEIDGGLDADFLYGQRGGDTILGGDGADFIYGSDGADVIDGGTGPDTISPGKDDDTVDGGAAVDTIDYRDINVVGVTINLASGSATGAGSDGLTSIEIAVGSPQADTITAASTGSEIIGREGADTLNGGDGVDLIRGDSGDDTVNAGGSADTVYAGSGADAVNGGDGNDHLVGDGDDDTIHGDAGADTLLGESGNDKLYGDAGNDVLWSSAGDDTSDGGTETDTANFGKAAGAVNVDLGAGTASGAGSDTLAAIEKVVGSSAGDVITGDGAANILDGGQGTGADTLNGGGGNDDLYGRSGNDTLNGGADNDYLLGHDGDDTLNGDAGLDTLDGSTGNDTLTGGADDDVLIGHDGADTISAGDGDDAISPGTGSDLDINGGAGDDSVTYSPIGTGGIVADIAAGTVTGASGNDSLVSIENVTGTNADDTLLGDDNANGLSGKGGVDTITGRGGGDTLLGGSGNDLLRGGEDDLDLVFGDTGTDTCGESSDLQIACELQFNAPPTLTIVDGTNLFTEGDAAKAVDSTLTLTDDEANTDGATVTIASGFESGKDFLSVGGALPAGVTASYVAPTLTISGTATVAQYQALLRNVRFENTSQDPSITDRTITFSVTDGEETDGGNDVTMGLLRINDAPVADTDSYSGGNHGIRLRVGTTHADAHEVELSGNVLDGDTDVDTPVGNLTVTPGTLTSTDCAAANPACANNVNMASDGTFTYDPPAGGDASDTFTYTVEDNDTGDSDGTEDTHTNTVTIGMSGTRAWFVDDSAPAGGRGVSHAPLQSLAQLATGGNLNEEDGANDRIFVYSGTYTSGLDLETGQRLLGEPHGLNIGGTQFVAAGGTRPAMSSTTGNVVTLHSGANEVQDVNLGNTPAAGYSLHAPTGVGAFTVQDTDIANATGGGLHVADGTPAVTLGTLSSSGSASHGLRIADTEGGTVSSTGGTLGNSALADFATSASNTTVTLGSAINDDVGQLVNVSGGSGDVTYNGSIYDGGDGDGDGVTITGTSGDHNFTKAVSLSTGNSNAMSMTNSASGSLRMVPTVSSNFLTTTGGAALTVTDTPIASGGLLFERISAVDPAIDATTYGIHLSNTGGAGSLVVAGTGGTCTQANNAGCTGGTISGKSTGIKLNNTTSPSFTRMKLTNTGDFGIKGDSVTGFNLNTSVIDGSGGGHGNDVSLDEGAVSFDELLGTGVTITNSVIKEGHENDLRIKNDSGTLNRLTVSGTQFGSSSASHNDSIQIEGNANAVLNTTVQNSTFTSARGDQYQSVIQDNATGDMVFTGNTITNSHPSSVGGGVLVAAGGNGDMSNTINGNNINGAKGSALVAEKLFGGGGIANDGVISGSISGNTVGTAGVASSGSANGSGIFLRELGRGRHTVQVTNNTLRGYRDHGIAMFAGGAPTSSTGLPSHDGDLNLTITGNNVAQPNGTGAGTGGGIYLQNGTNSPDAYDVCVTANNNTINGSAPLALGSTDFLMFQRFDTKFYLPGYTGPADNAGGTLTSNLNSYFHPRFVGGVQALGGNTSTQYLVNTASATGGYFNTAGGAPCAMS